MGRTCVLICTLRKDLINEVEMSRDVTLREDPLNEVEMKAVLLRYRQYIYQHKKENTRLLTVTKLKVLILGLYNFCTYPLT